MPVPTRAICIALSIKLWTGIVVEAGEGMQIENRGLWGRAGFPRQRSNSFRARMTCLFPAKTDVFQPLHYGQPPSHALRSFHDVLPYVQYDAYCLLAPYSMADSILLYRYMDADAALKSIEARRFKVGRLKDFNDPFEWRIGITGIIPEGEIVARACMDAFVDDMHSTFGIICFSDTLSRPVLWSHYAASHRGVAFEVNYRIEPDKLHQVQYSDDRPVLDANRLHDPKGLAVSM